MFKLRSLSIFISWTLLVLLVTAGCTDQATDNESSTTTSRQERKPARQKPAITVPQNAYSDVEAALNAAIAAKQQDDDKALLRVETWLQQQGTTVIPALTTVLHDENAEVSRRIIACRSLATLGSPARDELLKMTSSKQPRLRITAIERISLIRPADEQTVQRLIELLDDQDYQCRRIAIQSLRRIGSRARSAIPKLQQLANQSDDDLISGEARKALKEIDPRHTLSGLRNSKS